MTSQNFALWDINIALWAIYLFIVTRIFHLWKMTYWTFDWHYSATSWNIFMRFSAKRFALAALSAYYRYTEIVKTLSPVLRKYSNPFKRPGVYPSISKCNAKRCNCCMHLCTNSTITSSVNGRKFSVVNNSDLDWKSIDLCFNLKDQKL